MQSRDRLDAIIKLGFREPAGGYDFLTNLRTYPAVLLFYAYGIGLLKAQRFGDLFKLFSTPINTGRDHIPTVASHLLLGRWEGMENDPWKRFMPGLEKRKTALSDHLHDLFESWTFDYLFTKGEYASLFEHFELLGALAYISLSNDKATLQAEVQNPSGLVWCPMGRAAWHGSVSRPILDSWKGDVGPLLLKAGFAHGDKDYLPLAIKSIGRLSSRLG